MRGDDQARHAGVGRDSYGRLVNAVGMRANKSAARARKRYWRRNNHITVAGREVFDRPSIFDLAAADVIQVIRDVGQSPHVAYTAGMSRLSYSFCVLAYRADLRRAAKPRASLYRRSVELEARIGHTLSPSRVPLPQLTGIPLEPSAAALFPYRVFQQYETRPNRAAL